MPGKDLYSDCRLGIPAGRAGQKRRDDIHELLTTVLRRMSSLSLTARQIGAIGVRLQVAVRASAGEDACFTMRYVPMHIAFQI